MASTEAVHDNEASAAPFHLRRPASPALRGVVTDIVGYRENGRKLQGQVEMAELVVPLVISFGMPFSIALGRRPTGDDSYGSFTSGLFPGHVLIDSSGDAECIQIDFTPLGARRFFGLPMSELASRMVSLDALGDRGLVELRQRLAEERNWSRRLCLAETFVMARLHAAPRVDPAVAWAFDRIASGGGDIRIAQIAAELEWSRKHLSQRFREQLGLGPKAIARMMRFHNALALARGGASPDWADIAAACGYSDQAHLTREFSAFAGAPPASLMAAA
jgi:AraC-like DNA-binding protein